jgi:putative redox protein
MAETDCEKVSVRTFKDHTKVDIGNRSIEVDRRDNPYRENICPMELVSAALGSCISMTIAAVAEEKGIALEKIEVQVVRKTVVKDDWKTQYSIQIDLGKGLSKREQVLLYNAARTCEVGRMVSGEIKFEYQLI